MVVARKLTSTLTSCLVKGRSREPSKHSALFDLLNLSVSDLTPDQQGFVKSFVALETSRAWLSATLSCFVGLVEETSNK